MGEESLFQGTYMVEVIEIVKKGEFIDVAQPLDRIDIFVRDMTLLEKGLATYLMRVSKRMDTLAMMLRNAKDGGLSRKEYNQLLQTINRYNVEMNLANNYLWYSIKLSDVKKNSLIMIRSGFKVVKHEIDLCQCQSCREMLRIMAEEKSNAINLAAASCLNTQFLI